MHQLLTVILRALGEWFVGSVERRRWRAHEQKVRDGVCTRCGYDLRATPDRCPECGAVPERPR